MKVLIIAPFYAPSSEVPSVRMISLSNSLIKEGHEVSVLCYSKKQLLKYYKNEELRSQIPQKVHVIGYEMLVNKIPFVSDVIDGWLFSKKLDKLVELRNYDIVFTTCGPYYTLASIPKICRKYKVPCVLDFRDLGAINFRPQLRTEKKKGKLWKEPIKRVYQFLAKKREKKAVKCASGIICVSSIDREKMIEAYKIENEKVIVATNGYDEKKLSSITPKGKLPGITAAVFGKFMYYSRDRAVSILRSIDSLRKNGVDIRLIHIGKAYDWIAEVLKSECITPEVYKNVGLKEYAEGMAILGSADFFVVEDTSPDDVGTKIYDYIFWNKPVVAAVPSDIPLAKLVNSFENGFACDTPESIESAVQSIVNNSLVNLDSNINVSDYSRETQNQIMMDFMTTILKNRGDKFKNV